MVRASAAPVGNARRAADTGFELGELVLFDTQPIGARCDHAPLILGELRAHLARLREPLATAVLTECETFCPLLAVDVAFLERELGFDVTKRGRELVIGWH